MERNQNPHRKGLLIVSTGVFILSFDALLVRLIGTTPWNLVFWRGLLIFLSLGGVFVVQGIRSGYLTETRRYRGIFSNALIAGLGLILFPLSLEYTSAANTVVILTSTPLFAAILARIFLKEKLARRTWAAICSVVIGIAIIFAGSLTGGGLRGDLIALFAALNFALNMTLLRGNHHLSRVALTAFSGLLAALVCLPFAEPLSLPFETYLLLGITGLLQMPLAMLLIYTGTRYLPAAEVSLLILIESILAPVWVFIAVNELPARETYFGGVLILLTLATHSWITLRRETTPANT